MSPSPPSASTTTTRQRLKPWQDLLCGAFAGMSARMIVAPLDVLKIRFQVQSVYSYPRHHYHSIIPSFVSIVRTEGPLALWKGNVPALLMVTPYAAIQFATFYQLRPYFSAFHESLSALAIGALAASTATILTYPLDLLRTRAAASDQTANLALIKAVHRVVDRDGLKGLYAGLQPTIVEIVPYMALHFWLYERAKRASLSYINQTELKPVQALSIGAAVGTVSKIATLPLDNAKKIMQVQSHFQLFSHSNPATVTSNHVNCNHQQVREYKGVVDVLTGLWRRHGAKAWFRGALPSMLKAAPNSAITFMVYEASKRRFSNYTSAF